MLVILQKLKSLSVDFCRFQLGNPSRSARIQVCANMSIWVAQIQNAQIQVRAKIARATLKTLKVGVVGVVQMILRLDLF